MKAARHEQEIIVRSVQNYDRIVRHGCGMRTPQDWRGSLRASAPELFRRPAGSFLGAPCSVEVRMSNIAIRIGGAILTPALLCALASGTVSARPPESAQRPGETVQRPMVPTQPRSCMPHEGADSK